MGFGLYALFQLVTLKIETAVASRRCKGASSLILGSWAIEHVMILFFLCTFYEKRADMICVPLGREGMQLYI